MELIKSVGISVCVALLVAAALFDTSGSLAALVISCVVHEAAHGAAIYICGGRIKSFVITPFGGVISYTGILPFSSDLIIALAGPAASVGFAYFTANAALRLSSEILFVAAGTSVLLGAFNLLPINPLDGGTALRAVLGMFFGENTVERTVRIVSMVFASMLLFLGLHILMISRYNISVTVAAAWLLYKNIFSYPGKVQKPRAECPE